jgi:hypothetical protein
VENLYVIYTNINKWVYNLEKIKKEKSLSWSTSVDEEKKIKRKKKKTNCLTFQTLDFSNKEYNTLF